MRKNQTLSGLMLVFFALGLILTSCEKEEVTKEPTVAESADLKEPPFKNYMVMTPQGNLTKQAEADLKSAGTNIVQSIPEIGMMIVNSKDEDFVENILKNELVVSVIPDYEIAWIPDDAGIEVIDAKEEVLPPSIGDFEPFYGYLWGMDAIDAPEAWNAGYTGAGTSVFVLDSGIDADHPDLSPNLNTDLSASFYPGEDWNIRPGVYFNHGTHVAGTIGAAANRLGVIGVAYETDLVAVKVLSEFSGNGPFSSINAGIVYAGSNNASVINMSLGVTLNKNGKLTDANGEEFKIPAKYISEIIKAQQMAIDYAYRKGAAIIVSAGNDYTNFDGNAANIKLPAGLNNVISISATAPEGWYFDPSSNYDVPASYTNYGRSLVDLAAPGGDFDVSQLDMIVSTGSGGYFFSAGTSMAAPHVSGVAALIIGKNAGQLAPHELEKILVESADKIDGEGESLYFGNGRINAFNAVTE